MNRQKLIPDVSTEDLAPKTPWTPEEEALMAREKKVEAKKGRSLATKALLSFIIVGAIIGIGILLPIKLIPGASSMLASVFNSDKDDKATTTDERLDLVEFNASTRRIASGDPVMISWDGPVRNEGRYALNYPCIEGTSVTLNAADGSKPAIPCGEPFYFLSIDNTMSLSMESKLQRITVVPLSFNFESASGDTSKLGDMEITVVNDNQGSDNQTIVVSGDNENASTTANGTQAAGNQTASNTAGTPHTVFDSDYYPTQQKPASAPAQQQTAANSSSSAGTPAPAAPTRADLQGRVLAFGKLNKTTGAFIPSNTFAAGDRVAVQFEVANVGGSWSGTWAFAASLPTFDNRVYQSGPQASLAPYSGTIYTLGFDGIRTGSNNVMTISIDPTNIVRESNEANNVGSITFNVGGSSNNGGTTAGTGDADLKVTLVGVGRMNGNTFVEDRNIETGDDAAIRFKVANIGGRSSGSWDFRAALDGDSDSDNREYESKSQASLAAGQAVVLTISFKDIDEEDDYDFTIDIDPDKNLDEKTRSNNNLRTSIDIED